MNTELFINDILSKAEELDKEEQLILLEGLFTLIKKGETLKTPAKLSDISGLGSNVWNRINIDDYIESERQW